jgi:anti-sigma B factor antagonist
VTVWGEVDIATADRFRESLTELRSSDLDLIVLDLSACQFMDSSGLRALAKACLPVAEETPEVVIGALSDPVRRLLYISGMFEFFRHLDPRLCNACGRVVPKGIPRCPQCNAPVTAG